MKTYEIDSTYRQFYVADQDLEPLAPDVWTDENVEQRHNTLENITALCPEGELSARICVIPPGETYNSNEVPRFTVKTQINVVTGKLGVYEWPWELLESFSVSPGIYHIKFTGYNLSEVESERDYYVVEFKQA